MLRESLLPGLFLSNTENVLTSRPALHFPDNYAANIFAAPLIFQSLMAAATPKPIKNK